MQNRAAIYCRLSEEDKNKLSPLDESESIQNQKSMLQKYALDQGWDIYEIYCDDDYAGADRGRPAFNRLLSDARERRFDIVLCKTLSRFTRELELVEKYIHGLFPAWGVRFVSIVDHTDTDDEKNKKMRQISGLINEWYLEDMSDSIRSVLTDKRKRGMHIGSFALYGYKKDPDQKGHLIIDKEAAAVVREVFRLYAQGYGKTSIARILNARGIPNPTEYKRRQGLSYRQAGQCCGTLWKYFSISDMLQNELYTGNMVQGKYESISYKTKKTRARPRESWYIVENTHEPIINSELWQQVQSRLQQHTRPFGTGTVGLFAGKARCAHCGYTLRSSKNHGRYYLRCPTRLVSKDACPGAFLSAELLEQAVLTQLNELAASCLLTEKLSSLRTEFRETSVCQKNELAQSIASCEKKISEYTQGLEQLYLDRASVRLSEDDFLRFSEHFTEKRKRLEQAVENFRLELAALEQSQETNLPSALPDISEDCLLNSLNREIVEFMIDHILVNKKDPETGEIRIEIHWKF